MCGRFIIVAARKSFWKFEKCKVIQQLRCIQTKYLSISLKKSLLFFVMVTSYNQSLRCLILVNQTRFSLESRNILLVSLSFLHIRIYIFNPPSLFRCLPSPQRELCVFISIHSHYLMLTCNCSLHRSMRKISSSSFPVLF